MRNAVLSFLAIALVSTGLSCAGPTPLPELATPPSPAEPPAPPIARTRDESIRAGLEWLVRHQSPDGRWSSSGYREQCSGGGSASACRHLDPAGAPHADGIGVEGRDVGVTALALLGHLSYGHTHRDGELETLKESSRRGVEWLLSCQQQSDDPALDGLIALPGARRDGWVLDHAIATMALAEQLMLSRDRKLLVAPVEAALAWCLRAQNPGLGWGDGVRAGRNDTLSTGWMVLALKTGKACAISRLIESSREELDAGLDGAVAWFDLATDPASGWTGFERAGDSAPGARGAVWDELDPGSTRPLPTLTAVGGLCRLFAGGRRVDPPVARAREIILEEPPQFELGRHGRGSTIDPTYWYFGTYFAFQFGGSTWQEWQRPLSDILLSHQRHGGCEDGSYDPLGAWGRTGGRVASTALCLLAHEVYYRFAREVAGQQSRK